jgi:hypothetical protein
VPHIAPGGGRAFTNIRLKTKPFFTHTSCLESVRSNVKDAELASLDISVDILKLATKFMIIL